MKVASKYPVGLIILLMFCHITGLGQDLLSKQISVEFNDVTIEKALLQIEQKGEFVFSYNPSRIPTQKSISYGARDKSIRLVLDEILENNFSYKIRGSFVIIIPKSGKSSKDELQISGVIRDKKTNAKIGKVTVYEVSSLSSDISNENGNYDLRFKSTNDDISIAISAKNYRDTVIHLSRLEVKDLDIALTRAIDTAHIDKLNYLDSSGITKFFVDDESQQNLKNVSLYENRVGQISFVPAIGTNRRFSGLISNDISINALAGYSYGVNAVEVGGIANIVRRYVRGVQAAGIGNYVGGPVNGVQAAGIFNLDLDSISGVQAAGIMNIVKGNGHGVQAAGIFNTIIGEYRGLQLAGIYNLNTSRTYGAQLSGIFNFSNDVKSGAQISGLINICDSLNGVQISSILNRAKKVKGVQIGLVNISDTLDGIAIGLVNYVKNGLHKLSVESNDVTQANLEFRMGISKFYNIYSAGFRFSGSDIFWGFGLGFGTEKKLGNRFSTSAEISAHNIQPIDSWLDTLDLLNKAKLTLGFNLAENLSIHAGPVLNVYVSQLFNPDTNTYGQGFSRNPFFDKTSGSTNIKMWLGYSFQIRF